MSNFNIRTTLNVRPQGKCGCCNYKTIMRGSTAILSLNLNDTDYVVDYDGDGNFDFKQLTLVFKQPNGSLLSYDYYSEQGLIDPHFTFDKLTDCVDFTLPADETAELQDADVDAPLLWELMIITKDNYSIIQPQTPIIVINSLYNKMSGHNNPTPYASESTLCSSSLVCNN